MSLCRQPSASSRVPVCSRPPPRGRRELPGGARGGGGGGGRLRAGAVRRQGGPQGVLEAGQRQLAVGGVGGAAAVAAVGAAVGAQEQRRPGQVVVEGEQVQV